MGLGIDEGLVMSRRALWFSLCVHRVLLYAHYRTGWFAQASLAAADTGTERNVTEDREVHEGLVGGGVGIV